MIASVDGSPPAPEPTRILVTGAMGFVGRHLIAHLLSSEDPNLLIFAGDHAVLPLSHSGPVTTEAGWDPRSTVSTVAHVTLDICDAAAVRTTLESLRPHQIYHLAARASGADVDRAAVFSTNVDGTRNLLEIAVTLPECPRVLLASTGYIYGNTDPQRPARESDPPAGPGRYGIYTDSKVEMEKVAASYPTLALIGRAFAHTGPGQQPVFAVPSFAKQLAQMEAGQLAPELRVGNLDAQRDMLDVRDVVRAYHLIMQCGEAGQIYNIGLGSPVPMREILDRLRALCSVPTEVSLDPNRLRPADIACSTGDATRLTELTGWRPQFSLDGTLQDSLDYWRKNV